MPQSSTQPDRKHLRKFGLTTATGFAILGAVSYWRGHTTPPMVMWTIAALLLLPALVAPTILRSVERGWLTLGGYLAWVNTRIILTVLFYAIVTPVGAIMRLFRDPLDRRLEKAQTSYWIRRASTPFDAKSYERQF